MKKKTIFVFIRFWRESAFSIWEIFITSLFYADFISDILLAVEYLAKDHVIWFFATVISVVLSWLFNTIIFLQRYNTANYKKNIFNHLYKILIFFQLEPFIW